MKYKTTARTVCSIASLLLLCNNTIAINPPPQSAVASLITTTRSSIKKGVNSAFAKIKNIKSDVVFDKLLENIQRLGGQVGKIKDCMLFGHQCSNAERAAFYATAVTILALTAVVVGFTIRVAATAQEPDEELKKAIETTSHEVKGWKPDAIFKRLTLKLTSFRQNLISMQQCLKTHKCTKAQKRTLYATAATIASLVTIAIGLGIGSYIYAKKKEEKRVVELPTMDEELKYLAIDPAQEPIKEPRSLYQQFLQKTIQIQERTGEFIQKTAEELKAILKEKRASAQEALKKTTSEVQKTELFQKAKEALQKAESIATHFLEQIKKIDILDSIEQLLGIDFTQIKPAITDINKATADMMQRTAALFEVRLFGQLNEITAKVTQWQEQGMELAKKKTELFTQWAQRQKGRLPVFNWQYLMWSEADIKEYENEKYSLAAKLDRLLAAYPQLVSMINGLDLATPGRMLNYALRDAATLLNHASQLKIIIGNKELFFLSSDIRTVLVTLNEQLIQLAGFIGSTTQMKPLIRAPVDIENVASVEASLWKFFTSFLWNIASPQAFLDNIRQLPTLTQQMIDNNNKIYPLQEQLIKTINILTTTLYDVPTTVKTQFIDQIKQNSLRTIAHAPTILRNITAKQLEDIKNLVTTALELGNSIIEHLGNVLRYASELLNKINELMGSKEQAYIHEDVVYGLKQMSDIITNMITVVGKLQSDIQKQQLPAVKAL